MWKDVTKTSYYQYNITLLVLITVVYILVINYVNYTNYIGISIF